MGLLDKLPTIPDGTYVVSLPTGKRISLAIQAMLDSASDPREALSDMMLVGMHIALTNPVQARALFDGYIDANYTGDHNDDERKLIEANRRLIIDGLGTVPDPAD